jgi:hypothetical protein
MDMQFAELRGFISGIGARFYATCPDPWNPILER